MNFKSLIKTRKVLNFIWETSQLRGRCWGPKRANNPYSCSNITMAINRELVTISQDPDGSLRVHEFSKVKKTNLGTRIKRILKRYNLQIKED